jgi:hypothetical protein
MADGGTREDAILLNEHPKGPLLISLCFLCFLLFKSSLFSSVGLRRTLIFAVGRDFLTPLAVSY